MNGDTKLILDTLNNFHIQNRDDIGKLFKKVEETNLKVAELPCGIHKERMKGFSLRINLLTTLVVVVLIGGIVLGVWMKAIPKVIHEKTEITRARPAQGGH